MRRSPIEIERKWLVEDLPDLIRHKGTKIIQGYIVVPANGTEVRVRRTDEKFFQTVKTGEGLKRKEIEIELSRKQFTKLWPATRGQRIEKMRYALKWHGRKIELDLYKKSLSGLAVVEVEFKSRRQAADFSPPPWFGREVTDEDEYKNANLATLS